MVNLTLHMPDRDPAPADLTDLEVVIDIVECLAAYPITRLIRLRDDLQWSQAVRRAGGMP